MILDHPIQNLLVVEDSDEDFAAFERIVRRSSFISPIYRCGDGDQALDFLQHTGDYADPNWVPRPSLILLDLNLPGTDGREVLGEVKQNEDLKTIPILVFTTSSNPRDIETCYEKGVNGYIIKPINIQKLTRTIQLIVEYWFEATTLPYPLEL